MVLNSKDILGTPFLSVFVIRAESYFENGKVKIWKEKFTVVKAKKETLDAFAVIKDKKEITMIIEQDKALEENIIKMEKDWRILTFDMILPFELVGFLAIVSKTLAEEGISLFAISAYSTDHVLVKEKDLSKAVEKLESLGCVIETED